MSPQTRAKIIGDYGCLAFCYLYYLGIKSDDEGRMIDYVSRAMDRGLLDDECTVLDASKFLFHFSGKTFDVTKKAVSDISEIKEMTPVRFDYKGNGHWVVVEDGKIVFNPLEKSVCVEKGKPATARIITLRK